MYHSVPMYFVCMLFAMFDLGVQCLSICFLRFDVCCVRFCGGRDTIMMSVR